MSVHAATVRLDSYFCQRDPDATDGQTWPGITANGQQMGGMTLSMTVRVTDTAKGGAVFTNTATIASDDPANDVKPFYNDNTSVVTTTIVQYKIYLPVIKKQ